MLRPAPLEGVLEVVLVLLLILGLALLLVLSLVLVVAVLALVLAAGLVLAVVLVVLLAHEIHLFSFADSIIAGNIGALFGARKKDTQIPYLVVYCIYYNATWEADEYEVSFLR